MVKVTIKLMDLNVTTANNRRYTMNAWNEAVNRIGICKGRIPIKIGGSESLPIGFAVVYDYKWPDITFKGMIEDDIPTVRKILEINPQVSPCSIGYTIRDDHNNVDVVYSMRLDSLVLESVSLIKSEITMESYEPQCYSCHGNFEPFEHIIKYNGNYYHENCIFDEILEKVEAKSLQVDYNGHVEDEDGISEY